jgi:hypothetical protein
VSVGVNVVDSVCVPTLSIVPAAGEYANDPGTFAVAFNCAPDKAVPEVIDAGFDQVIVGVISPEEDTVAFTAEVHFVPAVLMARKAKRWVPDASVSDVFNRLPFSLNFLTPSIQSSICEIVPVTVPAAAACIGELTVAPLAGWQIETPGEVGAEHAPLVELASWKFRVVVCPWVTVVVAVAAFFPVADAVTV